MEHSSSSSSSSSPSFFLSLILLLSLIVFVCDAQTTPPIVDGLSWSFYNSSCPQVETIIRNHLRQVFQNDSGQAAGLLRVHFHDCFVQGCDGSVLLDGTAGTPSEKDAPPNLSLRRQAFIIINDLRQQIQSVCGRVVSCADITTIAARDSVFLRGGPEYRVPLGRRDGLSFASQNDTNFNLPSPTSRASVLIPFFTGKNLTVTDLVALSGGHTIGRSNCTSFTERLYPTQDVTMNLTFASGLRSICPSNTSTNLTVLDVRTPNLFDNQYYFNLVNREGLFTSDQDLFTDTRTSSIVTSYAANQTLFFEQFALSMVKMGQMGVLTGTQGEIRANCSARNVNASSTLASIVMVNGEEGQTTNAAF